MADRIYNVAKMLKDCYNLKLQSTNDQERHFWDVEIYKWKNELMANNINPDSIDSFEFQVKHGAFSNFPCMERQAYELIEKNEL